MRQLLGKNTNSETKLGNVEMQLRSFVRKTMTYKISGLGYLDDRLFA